MLCMSDVLRYRYPAYVWSLYRVWGWPVPLVSLPFVVRSFVKSLCPCYWRLLSAMVKASLTFLYFSFHLSLSLTNLHSHAWLDFSFFLTRHERNHLAYFLYVRCPNRANHPLLIISHNHKSLIIRLLAGLTQQATVTSSRLITTQPNRHQTFRVTQRRARE